MSNSLVRTSLALFGHDDELNKDKKKRKSKSKGTLDLIPLNHRIITKKNKRETINLSLSSKLTIYEAKKRLESKSDPTEKNIERLLLLSGKNIDTELTEKSINRALKKSRVPSKEKKPEESTAFTEEDFKRFEEEYCEL